MRSSRTAQAATQTSCAWPRIVTLAEAARAELPPAPWEAELREKLQGVASELALPAGTSITRRSGMWSKLAALARADRPTDNAEFNGMFEVAGELRGRLSKEAIAGVVELSRNGELSVKREEISYRTPLLDPNAGTLTRLAVVAEAIAAPVSAPTPSAPYR